MDVEDLIARWQGGRGGAELANFGPFIFDLVDALGLPRPGPAEAGALGDYQFEGPVAGGSNRRSGGHGRIDLYKRGCFVMEAKQSQLRSGDAQQPGLFTGGARYDQLMLRAQAQAKNYAQSLPADHPTVPFLVVCDVGRAFELFFDFTGNGRGYGFFPDRRSYRITIDQLRDARVQDLMRKVWTDPAALTPRRRRVRWGPAEYRPAAFG